MKKLAETKIKDIMRKKVKSAARNLAEELLRAGGRRGILQRQRARQILAEGPTAGAT